MKKIFTLFVAILAITASYAVPARPGWQTKTQPDGTVMKLRLVGDENYHYWINESGDVVRENAEGYWMPIGDEASKAIRRLSKEAKGKRAIRPAAKVPSTGSLKGLVILVNFQDLSILSDNKQSDFDDLMNGDNYNYNGATGSVRKYFIDQSNEKYTPIFDVVGPVTVANNMAYYGGNNADGYDKNAEGMIVEACSIANALYNVDFTRYDNNNDGTVDFVYVIYAGKGEADRGSENTIWPHAWDLTSAKIDVNKRTFDGKLVDGYACSNEIDGVSNKRTGIGTITHEFSHVIGLPDLYDTATDNNLSTPGEWHVMDYGPYNNDGKTPPNYTIYDKYYLGWETPTNLGNTAQVLTMKAGEGYQLASSNSLLAATTTNTVYYIENRQQSGWDEYLPGHGLLIWKIQYNADIWYNNTVNNGSPLRYALLTAAGNESKIGSTKDPFPGTGNKTSWSGLSGKPLKDIAEKNGVITLTYIDKPSTEEPTDPEDGGDETPDDGGNTTPDDGGDDTPLTSAPATMAAGDNADACTVNGADGIKVGSSKNKGTMTITVPAGAKTLSFYAAAWKGVYNLSVSITPAANITPASITLTSDEGIHNNSPFTLKGDESNYLFTFTLTDITQETTFTLTAPKRFVLWNATYSANGTADDDTPDDGGNDGDNEDGTEDDNEGSTEVKVSGLVYADAYYYEYDGVGYYDLDMYKDIDLENYEYTYPEVYVSIPAKSKTALNGTYEVWYAGYWSSANDSIEIDEETYGTITIENVDNESNYSIQGSFVGTDGKTYIFNDVMNVWAFDYDNYEEITLDENDKTSILDTPNNPNSSTHKILRNGHLLIIRNNETYTILGQIK